MPFVVPRLNVPRPPKPLTPGSQVTRRARKKTGPKKKVPAAPAPTPAAPAPTAASMEAHNYGFEEEILDAHDVFDGTSASVQSYSNMLDDSVPIDNISLSLNRVDQSSSTFWSRISEIFHRNEKTTRARTIGSLQHRWSTIQECCNKWASCLAQVARLRPSGVPLQEQANLAQERYKDMDRDKSKKRPFTLFHCWTLLQHNEKWANKDNECPPKRTRTNSSSSAGDEDNGGDEERERSPTPGSRGSKRPAGRKQEKERLKKQAYGNGCKEAIQDMIETKRQLAMEKEARWEDIKTVEERKVAVEAERVRLKGEKALAKKRKEEQKIMFMDVTSLDDTQRAYVEGMRAKILADLLGTGGSGSGS
ncbi:unnamed protein product [Urochloa decumbens]|uniref:No apical meristem-associated C-terminal domain-containing protein n=1 Tax=Urochloa decumbens TaxID=240449 RepID=A0ABC8WG52_9POAL